MNEPLWNHAWRAGMAGLWLAAQCALAASDAGPPLKPDVSPGRLSDPPALAGAATLDAAGALAATNSPGDAATRINSMALLDTRHKLGLGDRVSFRIIEDEDPSRTLAVNDAGDMDVPYVGLMKAVGKTCKQLAEEIKTPLERNFYYRATVIVAVEQISKVSSRGKIYLVGYVRSPGAQDIPVEENFTVSKAILRAGGFTDFANKKQVRLVRRTGAADADKQTHVINVAEIWEKGKASNDMVVEPEDLIYIPARLVNF